MSEDELLEKEIKLHTSLLPLYVNKIRESCLSIQFFVGVMTVLVFIGLSVYIPKELAMRKSSPMTSRFLSVPSANQREGFTPLTRNPTLRFDSGLSQPR